MALKTETREIGGKTYRVTQLGTEHGLRLFFKLGKLVGPSVGALLREWQGGAINKDTVAAALTEFVAGMEYPTFRDFVDTFMTATVIVTPGADGAREQLTKLESIKAVAFQGDYASLMKWLGVCLEVNFASFFADMGLTKLPSLPDQE